jgi:hypothetical protein
MTKRPLSGSGIKRYACIFIVKENELKWSNDTGYNEQEFSSEWQNRC